MIKKIGVIIVISAIILLVINNIGNNQFIVSSIKIISEVFVGFFKFAIAIVEKILHFI